MIYKKYVDNTSGWRIDDLLEMVNRCAEYRGVNLKKRLKKKQRRGRYGKVNTWQPLRIGHTKSNWNGAYTGRCYGRHLNGSKSSCSPRNKGNIYLGVPHPVKNRKYSDFETKQRSFKKERLAQVVLHEIDHLLGLQHKDMPDSSGLSTPDLDDVKVQPKKEHVI